MADSQPPELDTDRMSAAEIAAFKDRERRGRDEGARSYMVRTVAQRGGYRVCAEDLTLLRYVAPRAGQTVLDAGAGVGRHALRIAPLVGRLVATDLSPAALEVLSEQAAGAGLTNIETRVGDLCNLAGFDGAFDTAYSSEVLQHIPARAERLAALKSLHRALKPGGRCVVNVLCWSGRVHGAKDGYWGSTGIYRHYFTPRELRELLSEAGFRELSIHGNLFLPGSLARRLPARLGAFESLLSTLPLVAPLGRFILGVGRA